MQIMLILKEYGKHLSYTVSGLTFVILRVMAHCTGMVTAWQFGCRAVEARQTRGIHAVLELPLQCTMTLKSNLIYDGANNSFFCRNA